jgi:uncharacterized membrane protein YfcA
MDFASDINPLYVASGFCVGLLVGLTGVGGGSLMTPALILLFGVAPGAAVGTDLLYACVTKTGGVLVHRLNGTVDWLVVRRLCLGSLPASALTVLMLHYLEMGSAAGNTLFVCALGIALMLTALALVFRRRFTAFYMERVGVLPERLLFRLTVVVGIVLGVLVTISSVGAGALGATALILLYPEMPASKITGSDIAHAVPLTLVAGIGHLMLGTIDLLLLAALLLGSLPGIVIGSALVMKIPERILRLTLAAVLALVAARLLGSVIS